MSASTSIKTKGLLWTDAEIDAMLRALHSTNAGRKVMTSTNIETTGIFSKVSEIMKDQGFDRNFSQIRAKFKKEKAYFYDCMEDHGGLPPEELWGPRFPLLKALWEQAEKPDFRLRRPAASGKAKKKRLEQSKDGEKGEASSTSCESNSQAQCYDHEGQGNEEERGASFLEDGWRPTYDELVDEVLSHRQEIARLRTTCEFMRQGLLRIKSEWDNHKMAEAIRKQAEESDSDSIEEEEETSQSEAEDT